MVPSRAARRREIRPRFSNRSEPGAPTLNRIAPAAAAALLTLLLPGAAADSILALCDEFSLLEPLPGRQSVTRSPAAPSLSALTAPALEPRQAVLTFDAAWSSDGADAILDTLDRVGAKATFFLAGRFVREHPEIARRIAAAGHEVGNHTYHHDHLVSGRASSGVSLRREEFLGEMESARLVWEETTGRSLAPLWRAPYGEIDRERLEWAAEAGYAHVGWSPGFDALDWVSDRSSRLYRPATATASSILSRLARRRASEGPAVILMHLGSTRPPDDRLGSALPEIIESARRIGYRFLTAGEAARERSLP